MAKIRNYTYGAFAATGKLKSDSPVHSTVSAGSKFDREGVGVCWLRSNWHTSRVPTPRRPKSILRTASLIEKAWMYAGIEQQLAVLHSQNGVGIPQTKPRVRSTQVQASRRQITALNRCGTKPRAGGESIQDLQLSKLLINSFTATSDGVRRGDSIYARHVFLQPLDHWPPSVIE
jgi:hypothetical protein